MKSVSNEELMESSIREAGILDFEQMVNAQEHCLCAIDSGYNVMYINDSLSGFLGIDKSTVAGCKCYEVWFGNQCGTERCPMVRILEAGQELVVDFTEKEQARKGTVPCRMQAAPLKDLSGKVYGIVEICQDVTEIRKVEELQRSNVQFLVTLLDTIPHPVFFKDSKGAFQGCNEVFAHQILGMPVEEDGSKPLDELPSTIGNNLPAIFHRLDDELITTPGTGSYATTILCSDGRKRDFIFNKATFKDPNGAVAGLVGAMLDITELKETKEKLQQQNHELKEALSTINRDFEAAAEIQRDLLPNRHSIIQGIRSAWHFEPCQAIGGDLLNVFDLDGTNVGFYLFDVSGHGVPAALLSVTLSRLLTRWTPGENLLVESDGRIRAPAEVLNLLNLRFQFCTESTQYFTIIYGILNTRSGQVRYANAGHQPVMVVRRGGKTEILEDGGRPVGWFFNENYTSYEIWLTPGDRVILYSDGIVDARGGDGTSRFGLKRLSRCATEGMAHSPDQSVKNIMKEFSCWIEEGEHEDDVTLLIVELSDVPE